MMQRLRKYGKFVLTQTVGQAIGILVLAFLSYLYPRIREDFWVPVWSSLTTPSLVLKGQYSVLQLMIGVILVMVIGRLGWGVYRRLRSPWRFYRAYGYNWKYNRYNGELANWHVHCLNCQTELMDNEGHHCYVCNHCGRSYSQNYSDLGSYDPWIPREVEKLTKRKVEGKLPQS